MMPRKGTGVLTEEFTVFLWQNFTKILKFSAHVVIPYNLVTISDVFYILDTFFFSEIWYNV